MEFTEHDLMMKYVRNIKSSLITTNMVLLWI